MRQYIITNALVLSYLVINDTQEEMKKCHIHLESYICMYNLYTYVYIDPCGRGRKKCSFHCANNPYE